MIGLKFVAATPPDVSDPARADIACFIGFVGRRPVLPRQPHESPDQYLDRLPDWLRTWFNERGWQPVQAGRTVEDLVDLKDVPVPVDNWEAFDAFFAWDGRPVDSSGRRCTCALGAAVRNFFAQGGRKCYLVRVDDPWQVLPAKEISAPALREERLKRLSALLPGLPLQPPADWSSWRGIGHLLGLPDVSFLCLPDLPEIFAITPVLTTEAVAPPSPEVFVVCAEGSEPPGETALRGIPAPRTDAAGFREWADFIGTVRNFLYRFAREVQFVAGIPLPVDELALSGRPGVAAMIRAAGAAQREQTARLQSAFVQLAYPWARTRTSAMLPGGVESPDGLLAGVLANNALTRGSWQSAVRQPVAGVVSLEPVLDRATLDRPLAPPVGNGASSLLLKLLDHVSVIGPSPGGFRLISDVTADGDQAYRPANVNRLITAIVRAARVTGEALVFGNGDQTLWNRLRDSLVNLLSGLWADGALAGDSADEAFEVRCDQSTTTQNDLDAGRVIVRVTFTATAPIVDLTVVLALNDGGQISLASSQAAHIPLA
jgi:hypothetical protein